MNFKTPTPLQPYWDLVSANVNADVLRIAIEWDLFRHLSRAKQANEVAAQLGLDSRNLAYILDILWSMDLLSRQSTKPVCYVNQPLTQTYFCSDSPYYMGDAFLFRLNGSRNFGQQLAEHIRSGNANPPQVDAKAIQASWAQAAVLQIAQEQRAVTVDVALSLVKNIPEFKDGGRLLDLGCGPGLIAIALLQACPKFTGEVFDFPKTVEVAQRNIDKAGLSERLQVRGGNIAIDPIGENFDLIWCSSVLHFMPDINLTLKKIGAALKPGGVFVCAHAEVPTNAEQARKILPYYLSMQIRQCHVTAQGELAAAIAASGFNQIEQYDNIAFSIAPVSVIVCRKEAI